MNQSLRLIFLMFLFLSVALGMQAALAPQRPAKTYSDSAVTNLKMLFATRTVALSPIVLTDESSGNIVFSFDYNNNFPNPLSVRLVASSCSCLDVKIDESPFQVGAIREIAPHSSGSLKIVTQLPSAASQVGVSVDLAVTGVESTRVDTFPLRGSVNVVNRVVADPRSINLHYRRDDRSRQPLSATTVIKFADKITHTGTIYLQPARLEDEITTAISPVEVLFTDNIFTAKWNVNFTINQPNERANNGAPKELTFYVMNNRREILGQVVVPVSLKAVDGVEYASEIYLGAAVIGVPRTRRVVLRAVDGLPFSIVSHTVDNDDIKLSYVKSNRAITHFVDVAFTPTRQGDIDAHIQINTSHPVSPTLKMKTHSHVVNN